MLRVLVVFALASAQLPAQTSKPPEPSRSTNDGVYSAEQASAGSETFMGMCKSCHTPQGMTGLRTRWLGRPLAEYFEFLTETMPKGSEGNLSPEEYTQVVAYLLKVNGMPAGPTPLPEDLADLRRIRIDTTTKKP